MHRLLLICIAYCCIGGVLRAQQVDSLLTMGDKLGKNYINKLSAQSAGMTANIDRQTAKYLSKLEKQEARLQKKLAKLDSNAAKKVFADAKQQYQHLQEKIKNKSTALLNTSHKYLPWLDSATTSLKFLEKNPAVAGLGADATKLKGAVSKVKELEDQFRQAASVKDFIRQRKEYLTEQLSSYNLGSELKNYNKTAYYYSQQINEYREALNDGNKAQQKALELLNRLPAFQQFMKKNSMLASLFAVPGGDAAEQALAGQLGLQTRSSVQTMIQTQLAAGGPNAQEAFQQNMGEAQAAIGSLRNKLSQLSSSSGKDLEQPDFKPNQQKTKTFLKRLEYGTNIQSVKSNYYFPTTTDIALSVGYKLNDKNIAGIGASYKMGWGKDIQHINLSSQGMGFRSFVDINLKGSFFVSGGFEYNYQPLTPSPSPLRVEGSQAWQQSGLLGISKVVSMKTKFFKKTKLQVLWDVLSYQQSPRAQSIKFRVGYSF